MVDKNGAQRIRDLINKSVGSKVSFNLSEDNPTVVKDWVGTGSLWLDSIICNGKIAGIPMGKISEIAGLEGTGKSYLGLQIAINAKKKDIEVVYFDSESAMDVEFIEKMGMNPNDFIYVQAVSVEFVLRTMESLLAEAEKPIMFIWDSLAATPTEKDEDNDFNPGALVAEKARILSKGFQKLTIPLANKNCALLILNQLKTNITKSVAESFTDPYFTPGGKAPMFACSLRVWLTSSHAKGSYVRDGNENVIGTQVRAKIKKSRFGSFGREAEFKILWAGEKVAIQDEESWLLAINGSPELVVGGAWKSVFKDGVEMKFQDKNFAKKLQEDSAFKERILEIMQNWLIDRHVAVEGVMKDEEEKSE